MTDQTARLAALGDALERAVTADLATATAPPARRRRAPRRLLLLAAALAVGVPAAAVAADRLLSSDEVARSMPAGTLALAGTEPTCTVVRANVEFHCTLARPPAPEVADWKGTVEPTVDATKHVNGGCRSLRSDGLAWECYLGREAVTQKIIGGGMLGIFAPSPGQG
jgi:hypothetical protein